MLLQTVPAYWSELYVPEQYQHLEATYSFLPVGIPQSEYQEPVLQPARFLKSLISIIIV